MFPVQVTTTRMKITMVSLIMIIMSTNPPMTIEVKPSLIRYRFMHRAIAAVTVVLTPTVIRTTQQVIATTIIVDRVLNQSLEHLLQTKLSVMLKWSNKSVPFSALVWLVFIFSLRISSFCELSLPLSSYFSLINTNTNNLSFICENFNFWRGNNDSSNWFIFLSSLLISAFFLLFFSLTFFFLSYIISSFSFSNILFRLQERPPPVPPARPYKVVGNIKVMKKTAPVSVS